MRLLLTEDDAELARSLIERFRDQGYEVVHVGDGIEGLRAATCEDFDAIIVDRMLPGMDGLSLVKQLRREGSQTPVLFLTTMSGIDDRVAGLEGGGDDYLTKPFALAELVARVNAITRRGDQRQTMLRTGDLEMDLIRREVRRAGKIVDLQPQEFKLLEYMLRNAGRVVTRSMLLENVWELHFDPRTNIVETHMSRLRGKMDRGHAVELIHTIRGTGYILRAD